VTTPNYVSGLLRTLVNEWKEKIIGPLIVSFSNPLASYRGVFGAG
jgi:hypothetical protein